MVCNGDYRCSDIGNVNTKGGMGRSLSDVRPVRLQTCRSDVQTVARPPVQTVQTVQTVQIVQRVHAWNDIGYYYEYDYAVIYMSSH